MEDKLQKMDVDKREKLINAALEEFGNHTFDKASTNVIVKNAGISKGLLYHYFSTKENLFEYLIEFTMRIVAEAITDGVDWDNADLLKRMADIIMIKLKIIETYPYMIQFSKKMYAGKSLEEIKALVEEYIPNVYETVYRKNINFTLFKGDIDVSIAIKTVEFTMDKLSETMLADFNSPNEFKLDEYVDEIAKYLKLFRQTFYI